jgi:hypothetical protein
VAAGWTIRTSTALRIGLRGTGAGGYRYQGKVAEGKLTFVGPARFQYELDDEGKIKANADGTISVAWWLRDERSEWKPWMNNVFRRA